MEYVSIVCPCVGDQVFIPRQRLESATRWAVPGGVMQQMPDWRHKNEMRRARWSQRYVSLAWIRDYARRSGHRLEWRPISLWRNNHEVETGDA